MTSNLKNIIFNKLYEDLSQVEIIPYKNSIWFIDREKKYWYLEFDKSGELFFRYQFFDDFFSLFSLKFIDYQPFILEWVEEVLNHKVNATPMASISRTIWMEELLNHKVNKTYLETHAQNDYVEQVLNYKVESIKDGGDGNRFQIEQVLNYKVNTVRNNSLQQIQKVEKILDSKI